MFPHNSPNERFQPPNPNANGFSQIPNTGFGFQQMPMYGNFQVQGMANFAGQQMGMPVNYQQNYMTSHQINVKPVVHQTNPSLDKHERYKQEQQRKFKNFGKSFKSTSIDSMLDDIVKVNTSTKKSPTVVVPAIKVEDDFGDFLQAQTSGSNSVSHNITERSVDQAVITASQPRGYEQPVTLPEMTKNVHQLSDVPVNLEDKMMESLDLNAPQQATRKFKPSLVDISSRVEGKTFQSSSKSANWSSLNVDESEFHVEQTEPVSHKTHDLQTQQYPHWILDPSSVPLLYRQVWEACVAADGMVDTTKVYPILLKSQLSNETLGQLWSIANTAIPGQMNQQELYVCLALIAETQNMEQTASLDKLLHLPCAPLPNLSGGDNINSPKPEHQPDQPCQQTNYAVSNQTNDLDDFDDFQSFQSSGLPQQTVSTSNVDLNSVRNIESQSVNSSSSSSVLNVNPVSMQAAAKSHKDVPMQNFIADTPLSTGSSNVQPDSLVPQDGQMADYKASVFAAAGITQNLSHIPHESVGIDSSDKFSMFTSLKPQFGMVSSSNKLETLSPITSSQQPLDKYSAFESFNSEIQPSASQTSDISDTYKHAETLIPTSSQSGDKYSAFASFQSDTSSNDFTILSKPPEKTSPDPVEVQMLSAVAHTTDKYSVFDVIKTDCADAEISFPPNIDPPSYNSIFQDKKVKQQKEEPEMEFGEFSSGPTPDTHHLNNSHVSDKLNETASTWNSEDLFIGSAGIKHDDPLSRKSTVAGKSKDQTAATKVDVGISGFKMPSIKVDADVLNSSNPNETKRTESPYKMDILSIKSDTNSVKSLEFTSLSQTILQQSIGTISDNDNKESGGGFESGKKVHNSNDYGFDDDYGEFCEQPPEVPDTYEEEFNTFEEGTSHLTTFDAFEYQENKKINEDLSLPVIPIQDERSPEILNKDTNISNDVNRITSTIFQPDENLEHDAEMERRIIETLSSKDSNSNRNEQLSKPNTYTDQWERCLSACYNVIASTNEIVSAIQSPSVCAEVVSSSKGSKFIADLSEVYSVACKICESARHWNLEKEASKHLHKQIQLAWNNLLSFYPSVPTHELEDHGSSKNNPCGVCLLAIKHDCISYGGGQYHSTCANFWINCVASTLPSLHIPSTA